MHRNGYPCDHHHGRRHDDRPWCSSSWSPSVPLPPQTVGHNKYFHLCISTFTASKFTGPSDSWIRTCCCIREYYFALLLTGKRNTSNSGALNNAPMRNVFITKGFCILINGGYGQLCWYTTPGGRWGGKYYWENWAKMYFVEKLISIMGLMIGSCNPPRGKFCIFGQWKLYYKYNHSLSLIRKENTFRSDLDGYV